MTLKELKKEAKKRGYKLEKIAPSWRGEYSQGHWIHLSLSQPTTPKPDIAEFYKTNKEEEK